LVKAPPGEEDEAPAPTPEEGSEEGSEPSEASPADVSAPPDASAPPEEAPVDPAADPSSALTPENLQAEYSKLAPEALDMHIKAALAAKAAVAGAPDASAGAPPMAPPAAPPMDPSMAMKSEIKVDAKANGGQITKSESDREIEQLLKASEEKISRLEALVKSQGEDTENLTKAIQQMLNMPQRKAVTSVAHLPRAEAEKAPLTQATVHARLKELSARPELKKSDRQLINDFYDGRVKADKLAPLFEDYK
jgi:hypothetical protein